MTRPPLALLLASGLLLGLPGARAAASETSAPAPFALRDPDGSQLECTRLQVRSAAHGPLALTELDMEFLNPDPYPVEGRFSWFAPEGASLTRFAREWKGKWLEAEVVEKQKARKAYSAALSTGSGGALLQRVSGNRFRAKVFPIEAGARVRLILSYTSLLPLDESGARILTVPLRGLTEIGDFSFRAHCRPLPGEVIELAGWLGQPRRVERGDDVIFTESLGQSAFTPGTDLVFRFRPGPWSPGGQRLVAGKLAMTLIRPEAPLSPAEREPEEWLVLVDTSASHALAPDRRTEAVSELVREIERGGARRTSVEVIAFDLEPETLLRFRAGTGGSEDLAPRLRRRGYLGATDLGRALELVGQRLADSERRRNVLLVSDGVPTLGERELAPLVARLGTLPEGSRLHAVSLGAGHDRELLEALVTRGRGRLVGLAGTIDVRGEATAAVAELRRPPGRSFTVSDPGAAWVYPESFRDVLPGQELVVFSRDGAGPSQLTLQEEDGSVLRPRPEIHEVPGFAPLLERQGIRAWLSHLKGEEAEATSGDQLDALRAEQVALSTRHRVLCPYTSLLLLNFEEDYERYGIDRSALAEVLVVGEHGVALAERPAEALHTFTRAEWQAARQRQREKGFPAGRDPLIKIKAPEDTRRVVALFPWGETKMLRRDSRDGYWKARFVIPRWQAHGRYRVVLVLTRGDGTRERLVVSFGADRRAPEGQGGSRAWRTPDGWTVSLEVEGSRDTTRAEALLPDGTLRALEATGEPGAFRLRFLLREAPGPEVTVPVTLFDSAHNTLTLEVEVELR